MKRHTEPGNMIPFIPEAVLERWLAQWLAREAGMLPARRAPKCWGCGCTMEAQHMWHIFFRKNEREAHVCDHCAEPYMTGPIASVENGRIVWHIKPTLAQMEKMVAKMKEMGL